MMTEAFLSSLYRASWQGGIAFAIVGLVAILLSRITTVPARIQHWWWRLVSLKFLIALVVIPTIAIPVLPPILEVTPSANPMAQQTSVLTESNTIPSAVPATTPTRIPTLDAATTESIDTEPVDGRNAQASWLMAIWCIGLLTSLVWLVIQWRQSRRIAMQPLDSGSITDNYRGLVQQFKLPRAPELMVSDEVSGPVLVGFVNPRIVLSRHLVAHASDDEVRCVLAHELAHASRGDLVWNIVPAIAQAIFWFHPMAWWLHRQWRITGEMACDELAVRRMGRPVPEYARGLLSVAVLVASMRPMPHQVGQVAAFRSSESLKRRLMAMKTNPFGSKRQVTLGLLLTTVAAVGFFCPVALTQRTANAQPAPKDPKPLADAEQKPGEVSEFGANMNFEDVSDRGLPTGWGGGGKGYDLSADKQNGRGGGASAHLASKDGGVFGTFTQCMSVDGLVGKRIELSGHIKSDVQGTGGLWMRVDGGKDKVLAFDNMGDRRIQGKTDWTPHSVVLDVPNTATGICFGFLMTGKGDLWGDDFLIRVVGEAGKGPKLTGGPLTNAGLPTQPSNLDFEKISRNNPDFADQWGGGGMGYELVRDKDDKHSGEASGRIARVKPSGNFGTFTQMFQSDDYRGKRIRLSGFLKTKDAKSSGLWMRIDGPGDQPLGFDNMQDRGVKGTTDWTTYEIELDVPAEATNIAIGFLLIGDGTIWGDDLKLEVVDAS
ncbi:Regulatory protein BlaR1 [Rubripirellula tenax]|uniref:Regulatory protein BlaR1 n=1 Tax=Rubripirellula tenax TaxID=2528015 RepID=A0A5C6F7P9_9BACT|nr:M56 family metallopeptidase [Rubripirellula tenax]TWU56600.1 Regulatory protein BlaR1 [Rubripirellula tenax]